MDEKTKNLIGLAVSAFALALSVLSTALILRSETRPDQCGAQIVVTSNSNVWIGGEHVH